MQLAKILKLNVYSLITLSTMIAYSQSKAPAMAPDYQPLNQPAIAQITNSIPMAPPPVLLANSPTARPMPTPIANVEAKTTLGVAAKALVIGRTETGTLKELEDLQREAFVSELRSKIKAANPNNKNEPELNESNLTNSKQKIQIGGQYKTNNRQSPINGNSMVMVPQNVTQPNDMLRSSHQENDFTLQTVTARVVNVIVSGGKAHADIIDNGIINTVNKGDKIGIWTVRTIAPGNVTIDRVVTKRIPDPDSISAENTNAKGKAKVQPKKHTLAQNGLLNTKTIEIKETLTAVLKPYQNESTTAQTQLQAAPLSLAVVPPLPPQIRFPDSTRPARPGD